MSDSGRTLLAHICRYGRWMVLPPLVVIGFALYLVLGIFFGWGIGEDAL